MSAEFSPAFTLPACPACSNIEQPARPFWRLARNTAAKTQAPAYHIIGCTHAMEVFGGAKLHADLELIQLAEEAWTQRVEQLFDVKVERWPARAVERFKKTLAGDTEFRLPGMTERLAFGPAEDTSGRTVRDPSSGETSQL